MTTSDRYGVEHTFTGIEERMKNVLSSLTQEYDFTVRPQYPTKAGFVLDFALFGQVLDGQDIAVDLEVDGLLWHSKPRKRRKDGYRTKILKTQGWVVKRFPETFTSEDVEVFIKGTFPPRQKPG
jgi:very-short-patch-repair endonuclease